MGYGSYFIELVDGMTGEREAHQGVFDLLRVFLSTINSMEPREEMLRIFEIRLLSLLGYRPNLVSCTRCGRPFDRLGKIYFVPDRGGIFCDRCCPTNVSFHGLSMGTIKVLEKSVETDLSKIHRLRFSHSSLTESREILPRFIQHHLNRELRSLQFLESVKPVVSSWHAIGKVLDTLWLFAVMGEREPVRASLAVDRGQCSLGFCSPIPVLCQVHREVEFPEFCGCSCRWGTFVVEGCEYSSGRSQIPFLGLCLMKVEKERSSLLKSFFAGVSCRLSGVSCNDHFTSFGWKSNSPGPILEWPWMRKS